ncbi:MAG TPA: ABC transporter ATP-binding protein [Rhizobiaceae bacterium]|nr:ABC transporter ATP-binding protein [Rhizobiaceae bacterium]
MTLLSVSSLDVALGGKQVLKHISFAVRAGEFVGLLGPNGAGKSTLLRAIVGLISSRGAIAVSGRPNAALSPVERARFVAYLPQDREIAWGMAVEDLVSLGRTPHRTAFAGLGRDDRAAIERSIRRMEVEHLRHRPATELSGGEKARVLIARALAQDAPLLLADEPTAGLDPWHQIALMRIFAELAGEGHAVVTSLHDLGLAARWCSRLVLVDRGVVVADGPPEAVLSPERLQQVYGVEAYFGEAAGKMILQPFDVMAGKPGEQDRKE